ncbi:hypothetical protein H5410_001568, partial [Solanum commersonii]
MDTRVSVNFPENWYVSDNFLGFSICYSGKLIDIRTQLIPLCVDGKLSMPQKLALSNHSECLQESKIHFFLVPIACLWDVSNANGKTPNDYEIINESELHIGIRRIRYEHHEETNCSYKRQRSQEMPVSSITLQLFPTSPDFRFNELIN